MIELNAPPVLLFSLDKPFSKEKLQELNGLEALSSKTEKQLSKYEELKSEISRFIDSGGLRNWIPIVIDADISRLAPSGFQTATTKHVQIVGGKPLLTATSNSVVINIKTNDGSLVNFLLSLADILFSSNDHFPRIHFISKEIFAFNCQLISLSRSISTNTTEQVITLTMEKGAPDSPIGGSKVTDKPPVEIAPMPDGFIPQ